MKKQPVLRLRPTQFALGMAEVEERVRELRALSRRQRAKYVKRHAIEVVRAPHDELYVIDRHHRLMALSLVGVKKVRIKIAHDFSALRMSRARFWRFLSTRHMTHVYDQFGEGPRDPLYLPVDIRGLSDDPYRSLAWMAERAGAFRSSKVPYYEFKWAQLFRRHKLLSPDGRARLRRALPQAIHLCRSRAARALPGAPVAPSAGDHR
jgi:hypothetical protein